MKKIHFGVILALLSVTACQHQEMATPSTPGVFYAELENPSSDDTRVYADAQLRVLWNNDDRITIFDHYTYGYQYQFTGRTGATAGKFAQVAEDGGYVTGNELPYIYSVYPYQELTEIDNDGIITIDLPAEQTYAANSFGLGANTMVSISADNEMRFKNVGGYFGLQLYGDNVSVSSITLKGNRGEPLAGTAKITPVFGSTPTMVFDTNYPTSETVTLVCPTPVKIGTNTSESTIFWIVVPPTVFSDGLTITVEDNDGNIFEKTTTKTNEIKRNTLLRMPAIEVVFEEQGGTNVIYYTTTDGNIARLGGYDGIITTETFGANIVSHDYTNGRGIIRFDGDVTSIGDYAFQDNNLSSITIPESVTRIGSRAFAYCTSLTSITIPNGVTSIGSSAFQFCGLTSITIPDGVTTIDEGAFFDCMGLTSVSLPESVTSIGELAFCWCPSLMSFEGKYASADGMFLIDRGTILASALGRIEGDLVLPEGVTSIGHYAFSLCTSLVNITIPDSVTYIGSGAFWGCTNLVDITIPRYVTYIGGMAFGNCTSLTSITLLAIKPPYVDDDAFEETNNAPIYVPAQSLSAYKTTDEFNGWFYYADRIQGTPLSVPGAVDLGLPSGIKWASFNLGATRPEEFGDYYAWGETEPRVDVYGVSTYKWWMDDWWTCSEGTITKYCNDPSFGYEGFIDDNTDLLPEDDAVQVLLGGNWRMPTDAECTELWDNCTWTWTLENGIPGMKATSITNGNSIFFPAASDDADFFLFSNTGYRSLYWSSSLFQQDPRFACGMQFNDPNIWGEDGPTSFSRETGLPIRPIFTE